MKIIYLDKFKSEVEELKNDKKLTFDKAIDEILDTDKYLILPNNEMKFDVNNNIKIKKGIFVYIGTYKLDYKNYDFYPTEVLVDEDSEKAEYKFYKELITGLTKYIKIGEEQLEFMDDDVIITIPNHRSFERPFTFEEDFKKLRKAYFKLGLERGFKQADSIVANEDYILDLFSFDNYMKENELSSVFYQTFYEASLYNQKKHSSAMVLKKTQK